MFCVPSDYRVQYTILISYLKNEENVGKGNIAILQSNSTKFLSHQTPLCVTLITMQYFAQLWPINVIIASIHNEDMHYYHNTLLVTNVWPRIGPHISVCN